MNSYIIYSEIKNPDYSNHNGKVAHCDDLKELIYQIRQAIEKSHQNVVIKTIQNAKPQ